MYREMLKGKIHRAIVTGADLEYEGSIAIDENLLDGAGIRAFEAVHIWNVNNGQRLMTYAIPASRGGGEIVLNGAAARYVQKGDRVIIAAFGWLTPQEAEHYVPKVVLVDDENRSLGGYIPHGVGPEHAAAERLVPQEVA